MQCFLHKRCKAEILAVQYMDIFANSYLQHKVGFQLQHPIVEAIDEEACKIEVINGAVSISEIKRSMLESSLGFDDASLQTYLSHVHRGHLHHSMSDKKWI